jgi:hypothetical protein
MNKIYLRSGALSRFVPLSVLTLAVACAATAAPTIVSTVPAVMATGVSPNAPVVITFSEAMDPEATTIEFYDVLNPLGGPLGATLSWSAGNTVLTATPNPAFPANKMIAWSVDGANPNGDFLEGENTSGFFTTGSGGGGGDTGHGTNAYTSFAVGKMHLYNQSGNAAPVLDPEVSYGFLANASMASNRPASEVQFLMASGSQTNLQQSFIDPEDFTFYDYNTNLTAFNAAYAPGNYRFTVKSSQPDLQVTVVLTAEDRQPNAPQISNYDLLTTTDVAQAIPVTWLAFQQGTAADYIHVDIWGLGSAPTSSQRLTSANPAL